MACAALTFASRISSHQFVNRLAMQALVRAVGPPSDQGKAKADAPVTRATAESRIWGVTGFMPPLEIEPCPRSRTARTC